MQGVRWYFPGEIGEVVPARGDLALPKIDDTVHPDFPFRDLIIMYNDFGRGSADYVMWQLRLGVDGGRELTGIGTGFGHGLRNVHVRDKRASGLVRAVRRQAGDEHRLRAGRTVPLLGGALRSHAEVRAGDVPDLPRAADDRPRPDGRLRQPVPVRAVQGQGHLRARLERPHVGLRVGLRQPRGHGTVQDAIPTAWCNCIAYSGYQLPPLKIEKMSPNVAVTICRWRSEFRRSRKARTRSGQLTEAWLEKLPSKEVYIWDYYLHGRPGGPWDGVPVYFPHVIADDLRFLKGKSKGDFIEVQEYWPDWTTHRHAMAANHLNVYVTARLYWDADQDVDALLEEYYEKFYGPAAAEMKAFVEYAEANWANATKDATGDRSTHRAARRRAPEGGRHGLRHSGSTCWPTSCSRCATSATRLPRGARDVPVVRARKRAKADLTLDGKLDEPFWEDIEAYPLKDAGDRRAARAAGSFRLAWAERQPVPRHRVRRMRTRRP